MIATRYIGLAGIVWLSSEIGKMAGIEIAKTYYNDCITDYKCFESGCDSIVADKQRECIESVFSYYSIIGIGVGACVGLVGHYIAHNYITEEA